MKNLFRSIPAAFGIVTLAIGTLLMPISCTKEVFSDVLDDDAVEMTISVGASTKTTNDGVHTLWNEEDKLSVIHSAPGGTQFYPSLFSWCGFNAFSGTVNRLSSTNDWYVVYPYIGENTAADAIRLTFPATQTQDCSDENAMAHLAGENFPMFGKKAGVARTTELSVQMTNLLAVGQFEVKNTTNAPITVTQVKFTAPAPIAGTFNVNLTGDEPVFTTSGTGNSVTLNVINGSPLANGETANFYIGFVPFEAVAGSKLEIQILATDSNEETVQFDITKTLDNPVSFSPGAIQAFDVPTGDESHTPDTGSGTAGEVELEVGEEPEDGVYLLVYENGANSMALAAFDEYRDQNFAIPVVVENNVVVPQDGVDLARFAVELENTGKDHPNDAGHKAYNVRNSEGNYVFYATAQNTYSGTDAVHILPTNSMEIGGTTYEYFHTFMQTENGVRIVCSINTEGNFYLLSYKNGFNYQQDNAAGTNLHLFRLGAGTPKTPQNLQFSPTSVTYDFDKLKEGPLPNKPTLSGAITTVTWKSSNESVATVDTDGDVTIHAAGTAVITATAEANAQYSSGSAQYSITSTSSQSRTFYLTTEFVAGQEYLIVSGGKALTNNNGAVAGTNVSPTNNEIQVTDASIVWTATASSNGIALSNSNKYLQAQSSNNYSYSLVIGSSSTAWSYDGSSNLYFGVSYGSGYSFNYYLYYNNSWTLQYSASSSHPVTLYSSTKPLEKQNISFVQSTVRWTVGEGGDHSLNETYDVQTVSDSQTTVTYESSDKNVATISGTKLTLKSVGSTTITATAKEENGFKGATATYTLRISSPPPSGFSDLGTFNLENSDLKKYLDAVAKDSNYSGNDISVSIVNNYASSGSQSDLPEPVTLEWDTQSSGEAHITIATDQNFKTIVWTQTASKGSKSSDVYNLIPGMTYYCTVEDSNGDYLLKGQFETEGRRRLIRVSSTASYDRARNCRDLGGMVTTDGRRIKYGMIFRGTNLDGTNNDGKERSIANYVAPNNTEQGLMANYLNIGWDIDLRGKNEGNGDVFFSKYDVDYWNSNYSDSSVNGMTSKPQSIAATTRVFFQAAAEGKASYFHCRIGSDRTGFWGLLIEGLLGVSLRDCSIDYEITSFAGSMTGGTRTRNSGNFSQGVSFFKNQGSNLTLQQQITKYLTSEAVGITEEEIEAFKEAVLE